MEKINSLCVYCGSRFGDRPLFKDSAIRLGEELVKHDVRLVYGGGKLGMMGATAGAVRDGNGQVYGVIPEFLTKLEGILDGVEHKIVSTMHERKMIMFEESDAICTMPGGIGTLEEIIEIMSWARLDLHRKPLILVNLEDFWTPLVELIHHVVDRGFAAKELKDDLIVVDKVEEVVPAANDRLNYLRKVL